MADIEDFPTVAAWIRSRGCNDDSSLRLLAAHLTPVSFPKKHLLVSEGNFAGHAFFIERGMTRSYWVVAGEEVTTSFSTEGSIVFSMDEVYYGRRSEEYVETVEPVKAFTIPIGALRRAVESDLSLARWWTAIHQDEYRRLHRSHKERLTLPAAERYRAFAEIYPDVCRRGRLSDIASYLGITPSTLSRIRALKN